MHFTVHFRGSDTYQDDFSYGLVFIPCPVWVKGKKWVINLNPENPGYLLGSVRKLVEKENLEEPLSGEKFATVLIHNVGHGSMGDLITLLQDLRDEGFRIKIYGQLDSVF